MSWQVGKLTSWQAFGCQVGGNGISLACSCRAVQFVFILYFLTKTLLVSPLTLFLVTIILSTHQLNLGCLLTRKLVNLSTGQLINCSICPLFYFSIHQLFNLLTRQQDFSYKPNTSCYNLNNLQHVFYPMWIFNIRSDRKSASFLFWLHKMS